MFLNQELHRNDKERDGFLTEMRFRWRIEYTDNNYKVEKLHYFVSQISAESNSHDRCRVLT